jgi:hypothetical protein
MKHRLVLRVFLYICENLCKSVADSSSLLRLLHAAPPARENFRSSLRAAGSSVLPPADAPDYFGAVPCPHSLKIRGAHATRVLAKATSLARRSLGEGGAFANFN